MENLENNQRYMVSSLENTINSVQKLFVRESSTTSNLIKKFQNWLKFYYSTNYQHSLLQKATPIGSCDIENTILFHENLLTMHEDDTIDD